MNAHTFRWLLRRELWETRAIWAAPAVCAAICLVIAAAIRLKLGVVTFDGQDLPLAGDASRLRALGAISINVLAGAFVATALFTQFFYSLDALYADRRDRSILFWKSLPVSDLETVLAKYFMAAVGIPAVAVGFALVTHPLVSGIAALGLPGPVGSAAAQALFSPGAWLNGAGLLLWLTLAGALWYLPWIGWLLAVSAFAPRAPIMWAMLPPAAIALFERGVFATHHFITLVGERVGPFGLLHAALDYVPGRGLEIRAGSDTLQLPEHLLALAAPAKFFGSAGLWLGLVLAAAFAAAAVWARRYRDESTS
jgi:ABC-2 type transport system permease protein